MARKNNEASEIDSTLGNKVKAMRLARGMSRSEVAKAIGIVHQQLAKYEEGTNRVSAGRLVMLSRVLKVSVSELLEEAEPIPTDHQKLCLELVKNFTNIKNRQIRISFADLGKNLAGNVR